MTSVQDEEKQDQIEKAQFQYEPPARNYATRRQFRWLLILLLLNFAVTIQSTYWPGLSTTIKDEWKQWRERRRARDLQQQAMNWTQPPGKVVWDEDPATAEKLLATPAYKPIHVERLEYTPELKNWPRAARAVVPSPIAQFYRERLRHDFPNVAGQNSIQPDECALILMHNFKTPAGEDRLVYVYVQGKFDLSWTFFPGRNGIMETQPHPMNVDKPFSSTIAKELSIVAVPCAISGEDQHPVVLTQEGASLLIHAGDNRGQQKWSWTPAVNNKPEQIQLAPGEFFRFYAGQIDPADSSHFTIAYELDNKKSIIHGRIKSNGTLELKPDTGKVVGSNWYPQQ